MSLPKTSESAAKQILDSTRVFREYARVKKESLPYQGSLYWKKVGSYEYLVRKLHGKVTPVGVRSPETERAFALFKPKQEALKQRLKRLQASVGLCQRLNKAVKAGAVPTQVVAVLNTLEMHGLSEASVVLGTAALFAYGQPAGVRLEEVYSQDHVSLVEHAKHHLQVLVHAPASAIRAALPDLENDADVSMTHAGGGGERTYCFIECKLYSKGTARQADAQDSHWRSVATEMAQSIAHAATFEQVVIAKTGTMATMRTLDPKFFALVNYAAADARAAASPDLSDSPDSDLARWQASVVDALMADDLLLAKLPEAESRRAASRIEELVFRTGP